jgi:hypothetical protein
VTLRDYVAWFQKWDKTLRPEDREVGAFLERHAGLIGWKLKRLRYERGDALQAALLAVVEGVREAQALGWNPEGPLGEAWDEVIMRRVGAAQERARRSGPLVQELFMREARAA